VTDRVLGTVTTLAVWATIAVSIVFSHQFDAGWQAVTVGGGLVALGAVLLVSARIALGDDLSLSFSPRAFVTSGVYARGRHPMYLGGAFMLAGLSLALRSAVGIAATLLLAWPAYACAAMEEEGRLRQRFGDAYSANRRRTWI
jgi:protein-S-isoprenylcysteine O-methyltransferase Ste14